jgi:class 3 adenylate cyclase
MEPGEELRALQRRILQDDPTLMPGVVVAEVAERPPQLARKVVAVCIVELLVDEELDVEAARGLVSRGLASLEEIVLRHGGRVEQLLGEEALAVFGLPAAHEDDLLRALRAVTELRDALPSLPIRAAVETGEVLVGEDGRVLAGGALTTSRRVKEGAGEGEILLGSSAAAQSAGATWTEPSEGGARLVELVEGAPAIARRPDAPLVGRRAELERLVLAVRESAAASACRRVVVLGEPGIGKTRLAVELSHVLWEETLVLNGRCAPYAEGATYLPLAEVVAQVVGDEELEPTLHALLDAEPDGEQAATRLVDALSGSVAVDGGDVFWATRKLLETLARDRPLLVLLEDVHWAEATFLDLVEYLVGWSTGAPITLVCLARTELLDARPAWAGDTLALRPLGGDETERLLDGLPESLALDGDTRASVVAVAEGNPLFLEQLAAHALDDPLERARIPSSLESLLASRLDSLARPEREVLERAAVVGREFTRAAVDALAPDDAPGSTSALLALVRRRLVRPDVEARGEDAFLFDHALIWDATYGAIARSERARLHERLARWLDGRHASDEIVGHHLEQAVANRRATGEEAADLAGEAGERLAVAGERAAWAMDHPAARGLLERACGLLAHGDARRLRAECVLAFTLKSTGEWQQAKRVLADTAERARATGDRKHELWAVLEQLWLGTVEGTASRDELSAVAEEIEALALADGDPLVAARARDSTAMAAGREGRYAESFAAMSLAADAYEEYGLLGYKDPALLTSLVEGPQPLPEVVAFAEARLAAPDAPRWRHGYILASLAEAEALRGEFVRARGLLDDAKSSLLEHDQGLSVETVWRYAAGAVAMMQGDATAASDAILPALERARERDDPAWQGTLAGLAAEAALLDGDVDAALSLSAEARSAASNKADLWLSYAWRVPLARLQLAAAEFAKAEAETRTEIERWRTTDAVVMKARLELLLAEVLAASGRATEAVEHAAESLRLLEEKGATHLAEQAARLVAELAEGGAHR